MPPTIRAKCGFALLAATIFVAGCKRPVSPSATAKPVHVPVTDACEVLAPTDVAAVLGIPIDPGRHPMIGSRILCDWYQAGLTGDDAERVRLHFVSLEAFEGDKVPAGDTRVVPAPGIGDDAIYLITQADINLLVRRGNTAVRLGLVNLRLKPDEIMSKEKTIGLAAAARL
jgi:hypothetical protein